MTLTILIVLSLTILLSFSFELISHRIRIPTVVLLVLFGIIAQLITRYFGFYYPELKDVLPSLGTIRMSPIVLEGAMDLDLSRQKKKLVTRAFFSSLLILGFSSLMLTGFFMITMGLDFNKSLVNAVPFSVISSAVAIPATAGMKKAHAEFIIYESTFSDIMGIMVFNFFVTYIPITFMAVFLETWYVILTFIISLIVTAVLLLFLDKVNHHIKYLPILSFIVLVYALGKYIHLSQLIMVFMFGLIVNNLALFQFRVVRNRLNIPKVQDDLVSFKQLTKEAVFVAKTFFFVLFGFTADLSRFLHPVAFIFAIVWVVYQVFQTLIFA